MHILVTADTLGGVWTYTRELVTGLVGRGVGVTLVSFGDIPGAAQTRWMEGLRGLDYRPTAFKLEWMRDSADDISASSDYLLNVIRETHPDLLHFSQFAYGSLDCEVPRIVVAHSDVVSWWVSARHERPPDTGWLRWYRDLVCRGLSGADAVVAPSRWMLQQVERYYVSPKHGSVIHNGRTPVLFNPHLTKDDLIVSVGRLWDCGKNAVLLLRDEMPAPVLIIGAERHPELQSSAFELEQISANIHLEPAQDEKELVQTFARAAIYAATSQYEPFGLAPLEAALSRCAIVASDIPPFRELWEGTALFFRNNDAVSLRDTLASIVHDSVLRQRYANLAYSHARRYFSAERMLADYLRLYNALVPAGALA